MSVFTTAQPNFSTNEATTIVQDHYGLTTNISSLTSDRDQNFLCSSSEEKYVLKISNSDEEKDILEMQNECIHFIHKYDSALKVPSVVTGKTDSKIITIEKEETRYYLRLVEYLPGQFFKDILHNNSTLYKLGSFLGRLHKSMSGFDHPAAHRDFPWNIVHTDFIKSHKHHISDGAEIVDHFIELYEKNVLQNDTKLRKAVIHNDGNDHNILVNDKGNACGIIDFGDMVYSYIAHEPAVCMAYVALEKEEPLEPISQVLKGFHEKFPLTHDELLAVIYMVCMRLCVTVTMAGYRKKLFPDNEYLSISEDQAWNFLKKMQNENLHNWSTKLVKYAQS